VILHLFTGQLSSEDNYYLPQPFQQSLSFTIVTVIIPPPNEILIVTRKPLLEIIRTILATSLPTKNIIQLMLLIQF